MKTRVGYLRVLLILASVILLQILSTDAVFAADKAKQKELKVLVIEINPDLKSKGMKATDFFNSFPGIEQSLEQSIKELQDDLAYSSHNVIKTTIVDIETLNEFPRYTQEFTLSHRDKATGKRIHKGKGYSLDEDTYLDMFGKGWFSWWSTDNPVMGEGIDAHPFKFDYNYLIDKFDLVKRRNNKEFDMVWVFSIDPLSMGETNMVGRNPYSVNGDTIYQECDNFIMCGYTFSRRDSALECIGHLTEAMLNYIYEVSDTKYNSIINFKSIEELNTWERFFLCKHNASPSWKEYGVGQIHFAPNSTKDYEWGNNTSVQSTWEDWKNNYPNLTGETTAFNSTVYYDSNVSYDSNMSENRAHKRWWFSLLPHLEGRDDKGYSHNWWDYISSIDYVDYIEPYDIYQESFLKDYSKYILLEEGEVLSDLKFKLYYRSGKEEDFVIDQSYNYVHIENDDVITIEDGKIKALKAGKSNLTLYFDGRSASYQICVIKDKTSLYLADITVKPSSKTLYYNGTSGKDMKITISAPKNLDYSVSYSSKNNKVAKVSKDGKVTAVGKGTTYITTKILAGGITKEYKTKVVSRAASIEITRSKNLLRKGEQFTFQAKAYGLSNVFTWSASNNKVFTIHSKTGKLTAKKAGTAYVTVKNGKISRKIKVIVK